MKRKRQVPCSDKELHDVLDEQTTFFTKVQLDTILYKLFPDIAQTSLRNWRQGIAHLDVTMKQFIEQADRFFQNVKKVKNPRVRLLTIPVDFNQKRLIEHVKKRATDAVTTLQTAQCAICLSYFRPDDCMQCSGCPENAHWLCLPCFSDYAHQAVSFPLKCIQCDAYYDRIVQQIILPSQLLKKHEEKLEELDRKVALNSNVSGVLRCCNLVGVVEVGQEGNGYITCPTCKTNYCLRCGSPRHEGSCTQWSVNSTQEWAHQNGAQRCPNCHELIQKNGGCNHMTCRKPMGCGYEFCYVCLQKWPCARH